MTINNKNDTINRIKDKIIFYKKLHKVRLLPKVSNGEFYPLKTNNMLRIILEMSVIYFISIS